MSLENLQNRLEQLGFQFEEDLLDNGEFKIMPGKLDGVLYNIRIEPDWEASINAFYKARQYKFDEEARSLIANKTAEYQLTRLGPTFYYGMEVQFSDSKKNQVLIGQSTKEFMLSYFECGRFDSTFERISDRLARRTEMFSRRSARSRPTPIDVQYLFFNNYTARYIAPRKPKGKSVESFALNRIRACLFALAYQRGQCFEVTQDIKSRGYTLNNEQFDDSEIIEIPSADYDKSVVSFYKIAKSSQFPSQIFLSYYHILEYYFLRVADESLFNSVRAKLNEPGFKATYDSVSALIATINKNDNTSDERRMLREVLAKYVSENELIEFLMEEEAKRGDKIYSSTKMKIFGEQFSVKLEKGHALANVSFLLKHIRNALVHSSDRYSREECYMPFTESEEVVVKYIPAIKFLAERVIFATAE